MCGIAGALHLDGSPVQREALDRAASSIAHRGPDDQGIHLDGPLGLAHRRLAIIDLSPAGRGPMTNEGKTVWLTYNGEIYNFRELRRLLAARGHAFASHCDGEVLVHGYEEWGRDLVERLNGIFAFAIWDARERRLFLARDRFGAKPLYHREHSDRLVFASEAKGILAYDDEPARLSLPALGEYLTFQNVYTELTLFDGIRLLEPGAWLELHAGGSRTRARWFDPVPRPATTVDGGIAEELGPVLQRAVHRQLVADVPVGAYLSGDGLGFTRNSRGAPDPAHHYLYRRIRHVRRQSSRARGRRARRRRDRGARGRDGALRGRAARRRHAAGASPAGLAPRGSARRHLLPELLRGSTRLSLREGGAHWHGRR